MKIAIVGLSGLFPGSKDLDTFWSNLMESRDLSSMANIDDFGYDPGYFYEYGKGKVDRCYSLRGGYIRDFKFDPKGYLLDEDFLIRQDKLYQWSLYVAKQALLHSGYYQNSEKLNNCGVILGNLSFPTSSSHQLLSHLYTNTTALNLKELLGLEKLNIKSSSNLPDNDVLEMNVAEMVSKALGLGDLHYTLDAACATSLYAIKLACDELLLKKRDIMLAGAVCASDQLFIHMGFSIFHAYAAHDQKFAPLDSKSGGLVSSEGAGMVVLKRLEDAEKDGDQILGVIGGIGLSNDGNGKFLLSPNPKGQKLAFERAYESGRLDPSATSYLECHATGTPLGDKTELNSIADYFKNHQSQPLLGSVKSNMGHLLTAAGMTGLAKVLISLEKGVIPPNINLDQAVQADNQWIQQQHIITTHTPWNGIQAGINSFGFGGTNAHMVIQRYEQGKSYPIEPVQIKNLSIVGMDAHFGNCKGLKAFYKMIFECNQAFVDLPEKRWKGFNNNKNLLLQYSLNEIPKGAFIEDIELDLMRYKIQPQEAATLEPQQALILNVADKAIRDAKLKRGQNVAVLIAMDAEMAIHHYLARWDNSWQVENALEQQGIVLDDEEKETLLELTKNALYYREGNQTPSQHTSFVGNIMASRIASLWDFNGPAFTISSGENAVINALEVAQNMLSMDQVDAVVLGAVDLSGGLEQVLLHHKANPINLNEKTSISYNSGDEGWLVGEGAGVIVLKKEDDCTDQENYGSIQINELKNETSNFGYCELHANGNPSEQMKEVDFLNHLDTNNISVGSIKANIGHTRVASGMAAIIKTALCVSNKFIPGIPNWKQLDDSYPFKKAINFPERSYPWLLNEGQIEREAIINFSNNQKIFLIEAKHSKSINYFELDKTAKIYLVRGDNEVELLEALKTNLKLVNDCKNGSFIDFIQENSMNTENKKFCISIVADHWPSIEAELNYFLDQLPGSFKFKKDIKSLSGSYFTPEPLAEQSKISFVYPGSAAAYNNLASQLYQLFPILHDYLGKKVPDLNEYAAVKYLYPSSDFNASIYSDAISMMTTGVYHSAAYTYIMKEIFKINPDIVFGYSMGESASMWYSMDIWDAHNTSHFRNSNLFKNEFAGDLEILAKYWDVHPAYAQKSWVSLIVLKDKATIEKEIAKYEEVYLTFINSPGEVIISGKKSSCLQIVHELEASFIEVPFQNIIHHDFCQVADEELQKMHDFEIKNTIKTQFWSSILSKPIEMDRKLIAKNSSQVCYNPVDFTKTVNDIYDQGVRIFIETGANSTCSNWIDAILKDKPHLTVSLNQKGKVDIKCILEAIAKLSSHGLHLDLSDIYSSKLNNDTKRKFLKTIKVGGNDIFKFYQKQMHLETFVALRNRIKVREKIYAGYDESDATISQIITTKIHSESYLTKKTSTKEMIKTKNKKIGENGLTLQDYEVGDQLKGKNVIFDQEDLKEFATGSIAKVFGDSFAPIDKYKRRVMLPMDPYLLVSRVTDLKATTSLFKPCSMQTEYDIPYDAWFTTDRQIPWAVSVESGQCDLMLISYLGIDFENKGDLVYRLLDCTLTFVDDLPFEGQTLRYDISINSFVRNGDNLLFFFSYDCFVQDRLVLKMRGGCAGFFTDQQLEEGNGVQYKEEELKAKLNAKKPRFTPLLNTAKRSYSKEDLRHLIHGDLEKCFDDISYFANGRNPSLRLAPEKILMIDRITNVDLEGGAYGLGLITAEKDLDPNDWYFPCHFRDDEVLAGSLQAEGGGNLLRFFMLMLGLQRLMKDARYQPIFDLPQKVRCRKQVVPGKDTKLIYRLEVKEIGLVPNPYVIADLEIISNDIITVHFENLGLQLREKSNPKYLEKKAGVKISDRSKAALLNEQDITNFALDNLSKCFGSDFSCYDGRTVSRQPNTDLQLISRVLKIEGERLNFKQPSSIYAEYDVPEDAWYYKQNSNNCMPYSILMEIALQPCGLLGAYLGSTLPFSDKNLFFRNLDGTGEMLTLPNGTDFRGKTILNKSVLVSSVALGGTVLQNYTFELSLDGHVFYKGKSSFGFFPEEALAQQIGLDNGKAIPAWYITNAIESKQYMQIKLDSLFGKMKLFKAPEQKPHYKLSGDQLLLLDTVKIMKSGGQYNQGYIHATKKVKSYDWFFTCHFYQDPVMPGSLGVEAILQSIQTFAIQQDLGATFTNPKFSQLQSHTTVWKYRGQILNTVDEMSCEVHIKSIQSKKDQLILIADAYLWNGLTRIYQVNDLALAIEEA